MNRPERHRGLPWCIAAFALLAAQAGCTSALTATYLRDGLWDAAEHAAESDERPAEAVAEIPPAPTPESGGNGERRAAALEEAMARLSRLGPLDPAVEAAIVATLQRTEPEDWPVVVDEFAASLAAAPPPAAASSLPVPPASEPEPPPSVSDEPAPGAVDPAASAEVTPEPAPEDAAVAAAGDVEPPASEADAVPPTATDPGPVPAAALAIRRACFASAVRGWGDVDAFDADRFRPGQDVIVYLELDNLSAGASAAGSTTCIDAALRLVDDAGRPLHAWNFEPLAETREAPRRDYFARYVVAIPEKVPPGPCRVEVEVIDALAGATATAVLPLEVAPAAR